MRDAEILLLFVLMFSPEIASSNAAMQKNALAVR